MSKNRRKKGKEKEGTTRKVKERGKRFKKTEMCQKSAC
jgi:hypothetical protein